jgi:subtilisin family serine protease
MPAITFQPTQLDLKLYAGDGFAVQFVFVDKTTGAPWPLIGPWVAQVRSPATSSNVLFAWTVDSTLEAVGKITISATGEQTRLVLGVSAAMWDLQQTPASGEPRTWYRGKISALQDVTRA